MALIPVVSKFNLFQQIRLLLRQYRDGCTPDATLLNEQLRITSPLTLDAPQGQVKSLHQERAGAPVEVSAWYNGLVGAVGALPTVYNEWLIERQYRYSDGAAKAFIDLFDHRLYCLDYLAWQKHHLYAQAEAQTSPPLHQELLALSGLLNGTTTATLAQHATLFASPVRSMVNLERWLSQRFGVPARIVPFTGGWRAVGSSERCQLGNPSHSLKSAPMLGCMRREAHSHFDVFFGPMSTETSQRFTSNPAEREEIWSCVRDYVGPVLEFSVSLTISRTDFELRPLGQSSIGLDLCLGRYAASHLHQVRLTAPTDYRG